MKYYQSQSDRDSQQFSNIENFVIKNILESFINFTTKIDPDSTESHTCRHIINIYIQWIDIVSKVVFMTKYSVLLSYQSVIRIDVLCSTDIIH